MSGDFHLHTYSPRRKLQMNESIINNGIDETESICNLSKRDYIMHLTNLKSIWGRSLSWFWRRRSRFILVFVRFIRMWLVLILWLVTWPSHAALLQRWWSCTSHRETNLSWILLRLRVASVHLARLTSWRGARRWHLSHIRVRLHLPICRLLWVQAVGCRLFNNRRFTDYFALCVSQLQSETFRFAVSLWLWWVLVAVCCTCAEWKEEIRN